MTISLSSIPKLDVFKIDVRFFPKIITERGYKRAFNRLTSVKWNNFAIAHGRLNEVEHPGSFDRLEPDDVIPLSRFINTSTLIKRKLSSDSSITIEHRHDEASDKHLIVGYASNYDGAEYKRPGVVIFGIDSTEIEGVSDIPLTPKIEILGNGGFYLDRFYLQVMPLVETRRFYSKHYQDSRIGDGARFIHQNNTGFGDSLIAIPANYDKTIVGFGLRPGLDSIPGGEIFNDHFGVVLVDST